MQNARDCRLRLPYPPIRPKEKSPQNAQLLFPLYAGKNSELTAISTYLYQSIVLSREYPALSAMLECIAEVEMQHFRILGQMIFLLGARPRLEFPAGRGAAYWNGGFVNYTDDPQKILTDDIEDEKKAAEAYRKTAKQIHDEQVSAMLERIALDEEHHVEILQSYL